MAEKTVQVAFRFSESLVRRLDAEARRMSQESPGMQVTRADVVRVLLTRGLDGGGGRRVAAGAKPTKGGS